MSSSGARSSTHLFCLWIAQWHFRGPPPLKGINFSRHRMGLQLFANLVSPSQFSSLPKVFSLEWFRQCCIRHTHRCRHKCEGLFCSHLASMLSQMQAVSSDSMHMGWAKMLQAMQICVLVCPASVFLMTESVQHIAKAVDEAVRSKSFGGQVRHTQLLQNEATSSRLRIDEDFKRHLTQESVSSKRAKIAVSAVKAAGVFESDNPGIVSTWTLEAMHAKLESIRAHFGSCTGPLSVSFDGKRLGNPAEETVVLSMLDPETTHGAFLPVMVPA